MIKNPLRWKRRARQAEREAAAEVARSCFAQHLADHPDWTPGEAAWQVAAWSIVTAGRSDAWTVAALEALRRQYFEERDTKIVLAGGQGGRSDQARVINLTPHMVVVLGEDGGVVAEYPASGTVARLTETTQAGKPVGGVPWTEVALGGIEGLPEPQADVVYLVSMPLAMGAKAAGLTRRDLVYPSGQNDQPFASRHQPTVHAEPA